MVNFYEFKQILESKKEDFWQKTKEKESKFKKEKNYKFAPYQDEDDDLGKRERLAWLDRIKPPSSKNSKPHP